MGEQEEIGPYLKRLREQVGVSLREACRRSGVSVAYLSQVETAQRRPGPRILQALAPVYGATVRDLMQRAGHLKEVEAVIDEEDELERAYLYVLQDPRFRFGTRPQGDLGLEAKKFIVEMYERLTGRKLI